MKINRSVRAVVLAVTVVLAVGSISAAGGAASAKPSEKHAILKAIL